MHPPHPHQQRSRRRKILHQTSPQRRCREQRIRQSRHRPRSPHHNRSHHRQPRHTPRLNPRHNALTLPRPPPSQRQRRHQQHRVRKVNALHKHPHIGSILLDIGALHEHRSQQRLGQQQHTHPNRCPSHASPTLPRHKHPSNQPHHHRRQNPSQRPVRKLNHRSDPRMMRNHLTITKRPMVSTPRPRSRSAHHRTLQDHHHHKPQHTSRIPRQPTPITQRIEKGTHTPIIFAQQSTTADHRTLTTEN